MIPLAIFGGFGISQIYYYIKDARKFSSPQIRSAFLISILLISTVSGVITVKGSVFSFQAETSLGDIQIAPPSASELDVANWFNENGNRNRNRSIIISNLYTGNLIATVSGVPISYGFEYFNKSTPLSTFMNKRIGYIIFDRRLTVPSKNGTPYIKYARSEIYPLFFISGDIKTNIKELIPPFAKVVHENNDFIICKIHYQ